MIDNFSLAVSHGLILLAAWRLIQRADLDNEDAPEPIPPAKPARRRLPSFLKGRERA